MVKTARYRIEHVTRYQYGVPVRNCSMSLALKPIEDHRQRLDGFEIETEPAGSIFPVDDFLGNTRHQLHLYGDHRSLVITARSTVDVASPDAPAERCDEGAWETILGWRDSFHHRDFLDHSGLARPSTGLEQFVHRNKIEPSGDPMTALKRLSAMLYERFEYVPGSTTISSTIDHILDTGRGVCQDYAHVMIAVARTWGIPARYVSGYLHDVSAGDEAGRGMTTHAWVECLLPGSGWTGFDPTNQAMADARHVRVAVGRDYQDVSPTHGVLHGGGDIRLDVEVVLQPLAGNPAGPARPAPEEEL